MRLGTSQARTVLVLVAGLIAACPAAPDPRTPERARVPSSDDAVGGSSRGSGGGAAEGGEPLPTGLGMRTGADGGAPAGAPARGGARVIDPPWKGGAGARVVIEEFSDFECPFCQIGARTVEKVLKLYGSRVKLVFRHLPLRMHPQARIAAEAAVCAQLQGKFWPMHDLLFQNNQALSRADLIRYARQIGLDVPRFIRDLDGGAGKARVDADLALSRERGVEGTPAFFVNGNKEEGALGLERFRSLVDAELKR